jgi:hypothetical protein
MKGPKFSYKAGKGLTIAAADNNWSINFTQQLQIFSTFYMTQDNVAKGLQHGQIRIRRFRPSINVTSQQGFYAVNWTFSGKNGVAFDGDGYLNFSKINPYLPNLGFGYNPSIKGLSEGQFRPEDSIMADNLGFAGGQDRSLVLAWNSLPAIGMAKVAFVNLSFGHDEMDEYGKDPGVTDNSRSTLATFGIKPLGGSKMMGGIDMSSFQYTFAYESLRNGYKEGAGTFKTVIATKQINLATMGTATGDHTFYGHGVTWSPLKWLDVAAHYISWNGDSDKGMDFSARTTVDNTPVEDSVGASTRDMEDMKSNEIRLGFRMWLWGPKSGAMGGSASEGGITIAPVYSVIDIKKRGTMGYESDQADAMPITDASANVNAGVRRLRKGGEVTNYGIGVDYYVPGGWLKLSGIWDSYKCDMSVCHDDVTTVANTEADMEDSFNTFTLIMEYRF